MPIWFELLVLLLVTYVVGLAIGWVCWGRGAPHDSPSEEEMDA